MMWDHDGGWGMTGGGGWLALVVIVTLVAAAVAALVVTTGLRSGTTGPSPSRPDDPDAEADCILQRRFAAGEIDEDEFLQRRALLHTRR
ncbi:MAG TPA: SHOCT domain-containing protein [Nocardioides sp.]|uniref:SHOCT domain-containing protein n=1 Tax=Nocardioides sp. TaxID=35761 RepID=UPI002E343E3F|nr:SHOCT domain-containing protein [Nocardioides sp.]HEX5088585.1 SHOCT domain-containing protein [Nocardioides sp.]